MNTRECRLARAPAKSAALCRKATRVRGSASRGFKRERVMKSTKVTRVPLTEAKDNLSKYVKLAARQDVVITKHGRPAAVLIGFETEEDYDEYRLETDPRFLARIEQARRELREGRGVRSEDVDWGKL
jgi:prevent-host-death family protein